jgi:hypothetical protein
VRGVSAAAAFLLVLALPGLAHGSLIVDRDVSGITLRVSGSTALVNYMKHGAHRSVELKGAINARPPQPGTPQVAFNVNYKAAARKGGSCLPYTGPALPLLITACDGPDGSHWALQRWQRLMPNYGGATAAAEIHASHWTGDLPQLEVWLDYSFRGRFQHLFGRFTYEGAPVHGFASTRTGVPLDPYGRNVYLDTLDSSYGAGWRRENSFLAHKGTGVFCYGFYPHNGRPGTGTAYRLTVQGPGVTPLIAWTAPALPGYDAAADAQLNDLQRSLGDSLCRQG